MQRGIIPLIMFLRDFHHSQLSVIDYDFNTVVRTYAYQAVKQKFITDSPLQVVQEMLRRDSFTFRKLLLIRAE